jgi:hypothetical protein
MSCTAPECYRETTLYLCAGCIVELDDLLQDVHVLIPLLDGARAGTAVVRKAGQGSGGGHPGSRPPGSLDAMMLQAWLGQLPDRAHAEANDNPEAGQTLYMARIWVEHARRLAWGPEDKRVYGQCEEPLDGGDDPTLCDGQLTSHPDDVSATCPGCGTVHHIRDVLEKLRRKARGTPMPPREAREFLQKKARVFILKKDFENWVQLGRLSYVLDRVTTTDTPRRIYYPGDVLEVSQDMRARKRTLA